MKIIDSHLQPQKISLFHLFLNARKIRQRSLEYFLSLHRTHGDTIKILLGVPTFILNNPSDIKHILITNPNNYHKTGGLKKGRLFFGNGLLSSDGDLHSHQRRLIQPMFHSQKLARFSELMTTTADERMAEWHEGATLDIASEMTYITLSVVGKTLLSVDLSRDISELGEAVVTIQRYITQRVWQLIRLPESKINRRYNEYIAAINRLDGIVFGMIQSRHTNNTIGQDDLLSMLISSRHEDGSPMSDQQIRDEVVTLIAAGHETTANALAWTWFLLSTHPEVEARLLTELKEVLNGRRPTVADIPKLTYTEMVFMEAMRLYPPVWLLARRVVADDVLPGGVLLPKRSQVVMMPYVAHRNPRYFPEPEKFKPERFQSASRQELQYIFFPFSAGPRGCIGEPFARMEGILLIATIAQRYRLTLVPGQPIEPEPVQTLRPKNGILMQLRQR
jgi:cytochrome P450